MTDMLQCLNKWRLSSGSKSAFYSCDTCHYSYAFARTRVVGIATSPGMYNDGYMQLLTLICLVCSDYRHFFRTSLLGYRISRLLLDCLFRSQSGHPILLLGSALRPTIPDDPRQFGQPHHLYGHAHL